MSPGVRGEQKIITSNIQVLVDDLDHSDSSHNHDINKMVSIFIAD